MSETRHVRLVRNGGNRAVRIPVEFELSGDEAMIRRDGKNLILEPVAKRTLLEVLASLEPIEEDFPAIDDPRRSRWKRFERGELR